jgi:hypothetical protein
MKQLAAGRNQHGKMGRLGKILTKDRATLCKYVFGKPSTIKTNYDARRRWQELEGFGHELVHLVTKPRIIISTIADVVVEEVVEVH